MIDFIDVILKPIQKAVPYLLSTSIFFKHDGGVSSAPRYSKLQPEARQSCDCDYGKMEKKVVDIYDKVMETIVLWNSEGSRGHSTIFGKLNSQSIWTVLLVFYFGGLGGSAALNYALMNKSSKFGFLSPVLSGLLYLVPNNEMFSLVFGSLFRKRLEVQ